MQGSDVSTAEALKGLCVCCRAAQTCRHGLMLQEHHNDQHQIRGAADILTCTNHIFGQPRSSQHKVPSGGPMWWARSSCVFAEDKLRCV